MYVSKFQTTGCPNPNPNLDWWKTLKSDDIFLDMLEHCVLVKIGEATDDEKNLCCGSVPCVPTNCNEVNYWEQGKYFVVL